jgi:hypothetical protein
MATARKRGSGSRAKTTGKQNDGRQSGAGSRGGQNLGRGRAKSNDLPPNEKIQKDADEIYGDTEIPARKEGTSRRD